MIYIRYQSDFLIGLENRNNHILIYSLINEKFFLSFCLFLELN